MQHFKLLKYLLCSIKLIAIDRAIKNAKTVKITLYVSMNAKNTIADNAIYTIICNSVYINILTSVLKFSFKLIFVFDCFILLTPLFFLFLFL